jgi:hypothetical protein
MNQRSNPLAMIELMVTRATDCLRKFFTYPIEEPAVTIGAFLARTQIYIRGIRIGDNWRMVVHVGGDHDITGKDQYIGVLRITKINVSKLKVKSLKVGSYCYTHTPDLFPFWFILCSFS